MAAETASKRVKLDGPLIGTHNGHFHADEALAVYMLRLLPRYATSPLVRTRDPAVLTTCHTVVDVGGEYDPTRNLYDHHQRTFNTTFPGRSTKLSSAGLVYKDLGKSIIASQTSLPEDSAEMGVVWEKLYADFVEAFDANDNGISNYDTARLSSLGISPRFNEKSFSIAGVVNRYNYHAPSKQAKSESGTPEQAQADEDARFIRASEFTGQQFEAELADTVSNWLPARGAVREAFDARKSTDLDPTGNGRIVVLKEGMPWTDHLFGFEEADGCVGEVIYVLFPENDRPDSKWRIRAVSKSKEGFELRCPLPEPWRGVRDEELDKVAGIEGCVFVHASGFIGGNKTYKGALEMARGGLP